MEITYDPNELHVALCTCLGVQHGHGSKKGVAAALRERLGSDSNPTSQWYGRVLAGEGTTDQVLQWCAVSNVRVEMQPTPWESGGGGHLMFSVPTSAPQAAFVVVQQLLPHQGGNLVAVITRQTGQLPGEQWRQQLPPEVEVQIPQALVVDADEAGSGFVATGVGG